MIQSDREGLFSIFFDTRDFFTTNVVNLQRCIKVPQRSRILFLERGATAKRKFQIAICPCDTCTFLLDTFLFYFSFLNVRNSHLFVALNYENVISFRRIVDI